MKLRCGYGQGAIQTSISNCLRLGAKESQFEGGGGVITQKCLGARHTFPRMGKGGGQQVTCSVSWNFPQVLASKLKLCLHFSYGAREDQLSLSED